MSQSDIVSRSLACVGARRKACMLQSYKGAELCTVQNYSKCKIMQGAKLQGWHLKMPGKVKLLTPPLKSVRMRLMVVYLASAKERLCDTKDERRQTAGVGGRVGRRHLRRASMELQTLST